MSKSPEVLTVSTSVWEEFFSVYIKISEEAKFQRIKFLWYSVLDLGKS